MRLWDAGSRNGVEPFRETGRNGVEPFRETGRNVVKPFLETGSSAGDRLSHVQGVLDQLWKVSTV